MSVSFSCAFTVTFRLNFSTSVQDQSYTGAPTSVYVSRQGLDHAAWGTRASRGNELIYKVLQKDDSPIQSCIMIFWQSHVGDWFLHLIKVHYRYWISSLVSLMLPFQWWGHEFSGKGRLWHRRSVLVPQLAYIRALTVHRLDQHSLYNTERLWKPGRGRCERQI